jgi:hypothetical protein
LFYLPKCVSFFAKISLRKGRRGAFFVIIFVQTLMLRNASIVRRKKRKKKRRKKKKKEGKNIGARKTRPDLYVAAFFFKRGPTYIVSQVWACPSFLTKGRTTEQGCQMVCFQSKNPSLGKFWTAFEL